MPAIYDCLVLGLGPAGASFARLAPASLSLCCLTEPERPHGKPCGGLLAPDAQKELALQGLCLPKELLVSPQIFAVHTLDLCSGQSRLYPRSYVNLDRPRFDAWLRSLLPARVEVREGRAVDVRRGEDGLFYVTYRAGGREQELIARSLVGADGGASLVRRRLFPGRQGRSFVCFQQGFAAGETRPFYACIFDPATSPVCSWALCKDGVLLFGGAFPPERCRQRFEEQKARLRALGWKLDAPLYGHGCPIRCPAGPSDFCLGDEGVHLLGEAAGFVSPSSLEGISSALRSGRLLAEAYAQAPAHVHEAYVRLTAPLRRRLLLKLLKRPFMYDPLLRRLVLFSGLSALTLPGSAARPDAVSLPFSPEPARDRA